MSLAMERHQRVCLTSSWSVQGPYDINSILQTQQEDDSTQVPPASTHSIKLVPPLSANDEEDEDIPSCQLVLSCRSCVAIRSIEVISNARHVELYDNLDAYCCTVRGERLAEGGGEHREGVASYKASLATESPVSVCRLKFVSLTDKCQLTLSRLWVVSTRTAGESYTSGGSQGIDMAKVRDIMSSLQQPIPPNVQSLMQTVEQYQKNKASVLEDFQQAATARLTSSSNDPKVSVASNMAGMLSAFSKAGMLQQSVRTRDSSSIGDGHTSNASVEPNNQPCSDHREDVSQSSRESPATAEQFNTGSLSKLMASFGLGRSTAGGDNAEAGAFTEMPDMLDALRAMCKDVSHMRAVDREAAERSYGPEMRRGQEECASGAGNTRPLEKFPHANGMVELEQRLMGYMVATEERIMGRLERQMELLRDHIDLRFNKLEVLLQGGGGSPGSARRDKELVSEDLD